MEIAIKATNINDEIEQTQNTPVQYIQDHDGINFQTPIYGAELKISLETLSIQSNNPIDTTFATTKFTSNGKFLGSSCMCRSFLGKEVSLSTNDGVYFGVLSEEETKLSLKDKKK